MIPQHSLHKTSLLPNRRPKAFLRSAENVRALVTASQRQEDATHGIRNGTPIQSKVLRYTLFPHQLGLSAPDLGSWRQTKMRMALMAVPLSMAADVTKQNFDHQRKR